MDLPPLPDDFMVVDLRMNSGKCNRQFVESLLGEDDAKFVLSLPLGSFDHNDVLIWDHTRDGEYTLKSTYKFDVEKKGKVQASNPQSRIKISQIMKISQV